MNGYARGLFALVVAAALVASGCSEVKNLATVAKAWAVRHIESRDRGVPEEAEVDTGEVRPAWQPGRTRGFIKNWLVCGVFPNPPRPNYDGRPDPVGQYFDVDFLVSVNGEAQVRPREGQRVLRPSGSAVTWASHTFPTGIAALPPLFEGQPVTDALAYAYTTIQSAREAEAFLSLGTDDSIKVWLNGQVVHESRVGRGIRPDQDIVPVTFRKGYNSLLLKVHNGQGDWGFVVRVVDKNSAATLAPTDIRPRILTEPGAKSDDLVIATDSGLGTVLRNGEPVHVALVAPGGEVLLEASGKRGDRVTLGTQYLPDGPFELRLSQKRPEGHTVYRHLPWFKGAVGPHIWAILSHAKAIPDDCEHQTELSVRMLADLLRDRLGEDPLRGGGRAEDYTPPEGAFEKIHPALMEYAEMKLGANGEIRPHGFARLAWRDPVDNAPQFARLYMPPDYTPKQAWPMVVHLHGFNPRNPDYIHWWDVTRRHHPLAERHGVIVLEPHGRGNALYTGIGDTDVLRAIETAKETLNVDENRVYLRGQSMGGGGTWHVGTRHPELFAALGPIHGGWDYHVWMDAASRAELTPRRRFLLESQSSFALAESLLTTPVFVTHGDADRVVDVGGSRYAARMLQRWGYAVRYWEHPGKGHHDLDADDAMMRFFLSQRREPNPRIVRVRAGDLKDAGAHWVRVEQSANPFRMIRVVARVLDPHTIQLDTRNVLRVRLSPGDALINGDEGVRVIWNGADTGVHNVTLGSIWIQAQNYRPAPVHKRPELAGPLSDVMTTPFAIVAGTTAVDPRMRRFCMLHAKRLRDSWRERQKAMPRFFLDRDIDAAQTDAYSLILVGGPAENAVTLRLMKEMRQEITATVLKVGEELTHAQHGSVSVALPHPRNPDRYVSIVAAGSADGMYLAGQQWDQHDFSIYDALGHLASGRFDYNWQYRPEYVERAEPRDRARARPRRAPQHLTANAMARTLMLGDLLESSSSGSFTRMRRDASWQGEPLRLGGVTYETGIAVQAWRDPCVATYDVTDCGWRRLQGTIGLQFEDPNRLDTRQKTNTQVVFLVRGDKQLLFRSPPFRWDSEPTAIDIDILGVRSLELEVTNASRPSAASVNWADLRLVR